MRVHLQADVRLTDAQPDESLPGLLPTSGQLTTILSPLWSFGGTAAAKAKVVQDGKTKAKAEEPDVLSDLIEDRPVSPPARSKPAPAAPPKADDDHDHSLIERLMEEERGSGE